MQPQADPFIVPLCHEDIEIIFQDEHLLLINKPSVLLTLSGKHPLNVDSVHFRLVKDFPAATMVHRLDFGTSGLLIIALNKQVNAHPTKQFQDRTINKTYTALLYGHLPDDNGRIEAPIAKDKPNFPLQKICYETGKAALTEYEVVERLQQPFSTRVIFKPDRLMLHAERIEFNHPVTGERIKGFSPCPF